MEILYIVDVVDSAFNSQVLDLLDVMARSGKVRKIHLIVGGGSSEAIDVNNLSEKISVWRFRRYPNYPGFTSLTIRCLSRVLKKITPGNFSVVHCRGEAASYVALCALKSAGINLPLFVDVRGAVFEEVRDFIPINPILRPIKLRQLKRQANVYHAASHIFCVSPALKDYLADRFECQKEKITIAPCSAGNRFTFDLSARNAVRRDLGLTNEHILCIFSSGGGGSWQDSERIMDFLHDADVKMLMLSRVASSDPAVIVKHVPYSEVPKYLSAADFGVLFRKPCVVNHVASPIKVSEYLCAGLPVVTNRSVASVAEFVERTGFGLVLEDGMRVTRGGLEALLQLDREEVSRESMRVFGVQRVASIYIDAYCRAGSF